MVLYSNEDFGSTLKEKCDTWVDLNICSAWFFRLVNPSHCLHEMAQIGIAVVMEKIVLNISVTR